MAYVGRFAPSPTGPLHMGSLLAALASYLDAKANDGLWLLRIDDIDPPREQVGASEGILKCLRQHGLEWDQDIVYQSQQSAHYETALAALKAQNKLFQCQCSRKDLQAFNGVHPTNCEAKEGPSALRIALEYPTIELNDQHCGKLRQDIAQTSGPFVLKRKDGLYAYHLACVVDDYLSGITDIVRGDDLLESSFLHRYLQQQLGYPEPQYRHLPVIRNTDGSKLSKQTGARALDPNLALDNLKSCFTTIFPQADIKAAPNSIKDFLLWATEQWKKRVIKPF